MNVGLLIARLILGLGLAAHGAQKLFGWFEGPKLQGAGGWLEGLGFHPGHLFALGAGLCEFVGGLLTALGLLGPIGPAIMMIPMLVAIFVVHWEHGFFNDKQGMELPAMYIAGALAIASAGPGLWSLDAALGLERLWNGRLEWISIAVAVVIALVNVGLRRVHHPTATEAHA